MSDKDLIKMTGSVSDALNSANDLEFALEALPELIEKLEVKMKEAAKNLDFEEAATLRDRIKNLRKKITRT